VQKLDAILTMKNDWRNVAVSIKWAGFYLQLVFRISLSQIKPPPILLVGSLYSVLIIMKENRWQLGWIISDLKVVLCCPLYWGLLHSNFFQEQHPDYPSFVLIHYNFGR
jgi:hypothetical protein